MIGRLARWLRELGRRNGRLTEQARTLERRAALEQIATSWAQQTRRPTAAEIDFWIDVGRR